MTKYIIYVEDENDPGKQVPVKKMKREYEALNFIEDVRNLQKYGCMTIVKDTDDEGSYVWDRDNSAWEKMEA